MQARDGVAAAKRAKADAQQRCDEAARVAKLLAEADAAHERSVTALSQVKDARQAAERDHASADAEARALRERLAVVSVDEAQRALENAQHDASVAQTELNNAERAVSAFAAAQRGQHAAEEAAKQAAEQARKAEEALRNQAQAQQLAEQEAKHLRADLDFPRSRRRKPRRRDCASRRTLSSAGAMRPSRRSSKMLSSLQPSVSCWSRRTSSWPSCPPATPPQRPRSATTTRSRANWPTNALAP